MKRRLAIVGLGRLGKACGAAIVATEDLAVTGIVRRPESLSQPLPETSRGVAVAPHASELGSFDAALICLPTAVALEAATDLLQHRIPIVEAATVPSSAYQSYQRELDRAAIRHKVAAVVGAGWEPGMLSVFRGLFAMLCPKGHSETRDRPGVSLHHTLAVRSVSGVRDALCTQLPAGSGKTQRYVYVELERGTDLSRVRQVIESDRCSWMRRPWCCRSTVLQPSKTRVMALSSSGSERRRGRRISAFCWRAASTSLQ